MDIKGKVIFKKEHTGKHPKFEIGVLDHAKGKDSFIVEFRKKNREIARNLKTGDEVLISAIFSYNFSKSEKTHQNIIAVKAYRL